MGPNASKDGTSSSSISASSSSNLFSTSSPSAGSSSSFSPPPPPVKELRVLMLGLDGSGKSHLTRRMLDGAHPSASEVTPTISFNEETVAFGTPRTIIKDVSGKEQGRRMWKKYLTADKIKKDVLMFVVDGTDRLRFEEAAREFKTMVLDMEAAQSLVRSVLVVISKCDQLLEEADRTTVYQQVSRLFDIPAVARKFQHCGLLEVSSLSGSGLDDLARFFGEVYSSKK